MYSNERRKGSGSILKGSSLFFVGVWGPSKNHVSSWFPFDKIPNYNVLTDLLVAPQGSLLKTKFGYPPHLQVWLPSNQQLAKRLSPKNTYWNYALLTLFEFVSKYGGPHNWRCFFLFSLPFTTIPNSHVLLKANLDSFRSESGSLPTNTIAKAALR